MLVPSTSSSRPLTSKTPDTEESVESLTELTHVERLVREVEHTPALVYSAAQVDKNCRAALQSIEPEVGISPMIAFALKACYCLPVVRQIAATGLGVEVISIRELQMAIDCGLLRLQGRW